MCPDDVPATPPSTDPPANPPSSPPEAPSSPPATPPAAPATGTPGGSSSDGDRLAALETIVGNISDAVGALTDALTNGHEQESQPQKKPWTHWGSKS